MGAAHLVASEGLDLAAAGGAGIQKRREYKPKSCVSFVFQDVLTHIGEALRSFPKPSEDPRSLWQRLKSQKI